MGHWNKTKIGEFLFERVEKYKPDADAIYGLKRIDKIDFSGNFHIAQKPSRTNMILIRPGDLVISGINVAKGAMGIYHEKEDVTATIHYSSYTFDESKIDVEYFKRFLKSAEFIRLLQEQVKGGIKTEIKPKHILPLEINLPNIKEQRKILSHFKSIETEDGELKQELTHQQILLKKLRQQILQEAIEGKLTEDWRKQNPDVEPASELLKRIQDEKEQLIKDKKIKTQKPMSPISEDEKPFDLPDGWVWCRFNDVLEGTFYGPRFGKGEYVSNGIPTIRTTDMNDGVISFKSPPMVNMNNAKKIELYKLHYNDLLVTRTGSIGTMALYKSDELAFPSAYLIRCRFVKVEMAEFLYNYLLTPMIQGYFGLNTKTGTRPNINAVSISSSLLPLPPLLEQKAIVAKVEKLLALCDQLQTQITHNQHHAEQLMQAVLKESFSQGDEQAEHVAVHA